MRRAGRPTAGLTFDSWHYFRGTPEDALLRTIPGDRIFQVQLADATWALRGTSLVDDLLHHRLLPGEGEFPLPELVRTLAATRGLTSVGVELFSDAMDALPAPEVGRRVARMRWPARSRRRPTPAPRPPCSDTACTPASDTDCASSSFGRRARPRS